MIKKNTSLIKIGIDLDNTVISYDRAFQKAAITFGFVEENVKPTPAERDFIIRFWKTTGKYQRSTSGERSDFLSKKAADLAILVLAWRLASNNQVVAILTNDGDIIQTINKIKSARNRNNNQRIIARRIKCATFGRNPDLRPRELRVA